MASGFAFEITEISSSSANVILRNDDTEFRFELFSYISQDGLAQFLRAVFDVVDDRVWGAVCHLAGAQDNGYFVDVRSGSAWYEIIVFKEGNDWPAATEAQIAVFQARIDYDLNLARPVAAAYQSVLERFDADAYWDLWGHPFPQQDLDALNALIHRLEGWNALQRLQHAVSEQINVLGTHSPETIATALNETPERVAEAMRRNEQGYVNRRENDLHYWDPPDGF